MGLTMFFKQLAILPRYKYFVLELRIEFTGLPSKQKMNGNVFFMTRECSAKEN